MGVTLKPEVLEDDIAMSLARAMAVANRKARDLGVDVMGSLISISQHLLDGGWIWRINYGPKDYVGRRGGEVLIEVDARDATIRKVLRGQ